jgi:hypothetical protein
MPARTIKIDRSTVWGNPFKVGDTATHPTTRRPVLVTDKHHAISLFTLHLQTPVGQLLATNARRDLAGFNLACWCKAGDACHGDVLLSVANGSPTSIAAA